MSILGPKILFIITTHSPQILGEGDDAINLFYIDRDDKKMSVKSFASFIGWDANVILEEVMGTDSVNQEIKKMIEKMYFCIENKEFDEAEKLADILDEKSNGYVDGVAKARVLISRGRRREKNS